MAIDSPLDSTLGDLNQEPDAGAEDWNDAGWNDWADAMDMDTGAVHDVDVDTDIEGEQIGESEYTYITRNEDIELQDGSVVHQEYEAEVERTGDWTNTIEGDWTNVTGDALNIDAFGDTHYNQETGELETDVDIYQHHDDGSTTEVNYGHDTDFSTGDDETTIDSTYYENPATGMDGGSESYDSGVDTVDTSMDTSVDTSADTGMDDY